jgi:predicted transcriptional regulator
MKLTKTVELNQTDIANRHNVTPSCISMIINGKRHTYNMDLARDIAKQTGKSVVTYLHKDIKGLYRKAYPIKRGNHK